MEAPPALQPIVYKSVWLPAGSTDNETLKPGEKIVQFSMLPDGPRWQPGSHRIEVRHRGKLVAAGEFIVDPVVELEGKPPGEVKLTSDEDGEKPTQAFTRSSPAVYLHVSPGKLPLGTPLKASWFAVEVPRIPVGKLQTETEIGSPAEGDTVMFTLPPKSGGFVPGKYRVELQVDGKLVYRQEFTIGEGP